jgi:hypothetical protein
MIPLSAKLWSTNSGRISDWGKLKIRFKVSAGRHFAVIAILRPNELE